jgi:membrane associated rhomboid family serine protease
VPPPPVEDRCYRHPDRPTGRHCTRCGRPACPDCLVQASVGWQCVECVRASRPPAAERARRWNATHVAVFLYGLTQQTRPGDALWQTQVDRFQYDYGLNVVFLQQGEWYRLVTSGFVHFGLLHLGMNMFALWQLGRELEGPLGRVRFALVYVASLLGGSAGVVLLQHVEIPGFSQLGIHAGASGAIFGLLGAMAMGLRQRGVPVLRSSLGSILMLNLVLTLVLGLSIGAHVGGFVAGAVAGAAVLRPRRGPAPWWDVAGPLAVIALSIGIAVVFA